ncbi:MAG: hypothetical protein U0271_01160 [Polyangiaceae bacterium]
MKAALQRALLGASALIALSACGPSEDARYAEDDREPQRRPKATAQASASEDPDVEPEPSASTTGKKPDPTGRAVERLAMGWIGWIGSKRAFVYVTDFHVEGTGVGSVGNVFAEGASKQAETTICEPSDDCLDAAARKKAVRAWVEKEGLGNAVMMEPAAFTSTSQAWGAENGAIGGRVEWNSNKLELVRGKQRSALPKVDVPPKMTATPRSLAASPDGALLLVLFEMDPGAAYAEGVNVIVEGRLFKVP